MDARMIVNIVINSVPPGVSPAVALEQVLEDGGWIEGAFEPHRAAIDYERPAGMVRDDSVVLESEGLRFSQANQLA
jgi:hypothetical protein